MKNSEFYIFNACNKTLKLKKKGLENAITCLLLHEKQVNFPTKSRILMSILKRTPKSETQNRGWEFSHVIL